MTATEYQSLINLRLQEKFPQLQVVEEWRAFEGVGYQYSPRVDIAVGPFSVMPYQNQTAEYNRLLRDPEIDDFLQRIYNLHIRNIDDRWRHEINIPEFDFLTRKNQNARCFLTIEIENTSTKKHIMGSLINAASLGRIGIGVAYNESVKRAFLRIMNYLAFLKRVEKNTYDTTNFLIITKDQLQDLLSD